MFLDSTRPDLEEEPRGGLVQGTLNLGFMIDVHEYFVCGSTNSHRAPVKR